MKLSGPRFALCLLLVTLPLLAVHVEIHAQGEIDLDERKRSVESVESHILQRSDRLGLLRDDIRTLDARVEAGIDEIVLMLSEVSDSEDSRVRVSKLKGEVVSRLRKSIEFYDRYRGQLKEELRVDSKAIPRKDLEFDLAVFDERIEKRVEQIKLIAESFTGPQDLEKYEVTDTISWGWDWTFEVEEISEAWKQDRRDSRQTESMQEQLMQGLQDSVAHLMKRNSFLNEKVKDDRVSGAEKQLYQSEIQHNADLIEVRKKQAYSFSLKETKTLNSNEAHDTELLIEGRISDLKDDFFAIFRKYSELNKARAELRRLSDNLAARKQWLVDYEKAQQ